MAKPFLRWAGSKRQLLVHLVRYWPGGTTRYIEPFAGSACLFFELEPHSAVLGDINSDLIGMYTVVREQPAEVHRVLALWTNDEAVYYRVREMDPETMDEVDRAARFIYLNRFCFNGLYRTNRAGRFNVPYGGRRTGPIPSVESLISASRVLSRAELVTGDFEKVLDVAKEGDFVYLDPPFSTTKRRAFTQYDSAGFGAQDLKRLRGVLENLDSCGANFLLSYAHCDMGQQLSESFSSLVVSAKRNIAGFTGVRRLAKELIVTNVQRMEAGDYGEST